MACVFFGFIHFYFILGGEFWIDSNPGLDYESGRTQYIMNITVTDGVFSVVSNITVNVQNTNDLPVFDNLGNGTSSVGENYVGIIHVISISDQDGSPYSISMTFSPPVPPLSLEGPPFDFNPLTS